MLERIDRVLFYFTIDCPLCHNKIKVTHVSLEELKGALSCSLCAKPIKVPDFEILMKAGKDLNEYLTSNTNRKFIKLTMNEAYVVETDAPPAH